MHPASVPPELTLSLSHRQSALQQPREPMGLPPNTARAFKYAVRQAQTGFAPFRGKMTPSHAALAFASQGDAVPT